MNDDFENNDLYIFELIRNIENEIENEARDITDVDSDEVEDKAANKTEEETSDEIEEETINVKNKKKISKSNSTVRIKNKPTPEGYKILSLCDSGYTYCFIFTSHIESIESNSEINPIPNVNKIGWQVYHLISQLPKGKAFDIYMDNYFTSINLFSHMRKNGYGGCGTDMVTIDYDNDKKPPKRLKDQGPSTKLYLVIVGQSNDSKHGKRVTTTATSTDTTTSAGITAPTQTVVSTETVMLIETSTIALPSTTG
ncbi:6377_t:CDS:2 [Dentiscutata erythropus]|uniref:6377_t:CDS:1 n=1 Tax=Dentiscutata erythropus TaxID=1348616 RepID=A0A9N9EMB5_9GLOM|nr:6377_t:CDS:2 [Dentiscutata erythropus]